MPADQEIKDRMSEERDEVRTERLMEDGVGQEVGLQVQSACASLTSTAARQSRWREEGVFNNFVP